MDMQTVFEIAIPVLILSQRTCRTLLWLSNICHDPIFQGIRVQVNDHYTISDINQQ